MFIALATWPLLAPAATRHRISSSRSGRCPEPWRTFSTTPATGGLAPICTASAGHAADAAQLTTLLDDRGFLAAAELPRLFVALQRPPSRLPATRRSTGTYIPTCTRCRHRGARASYLQLVAQRFQARIADQLIPASPAQLTDRTGAEHSVSCR
jgi:hypothetical protein